MLKDQSSSNLRLSAFLLFFFNHSSVVVFFFNWLTDLCLTSLSTIFQSYRDGVWKWQGAQCSLLECCLTEISHHRHFDMIFHPDTLYWHWADQFYFLIAECQAKVQLVPFLKSLVWPGQGLNPQPPGHKADALPLSHCADVFFFFFLNIPTSTVRGIHVSKWQSARSSLLFLAPHQVGFFRISRFIPDGICSNKTQSTRKIKLFLVV